MPRLNQETDPVPDQDVDPIVGYKIVIASEKTSEGRRAVVGGHGGVTFQIPRDIEVVVSPAIMGVLRDAMVPEVEIEGETVNVRMVRRYPISEYGPVRASETTVNADAAA